MLVCLTIIAQASSIAWLAPSTSESFANLAEKSAVIPFAVLSPCSTRIISINVIRATDMVAARLLGVRREDELQVGTHEPNDEARLGDGIMVAMDETVLESMTF